jgi:DNA repair protein RAD51
MIKTGLEKLDNILGGGIKSGIITDIFGASGTGKSHLALQIMASSLLEGGTTFYQDTTGNFRPERMLEMFKPKGLDPNLLDKITVGRITNTSEQLGNISKIYESNFSLVIVDNVSDLFSFEYSKEGQMLEKTNQFAQYMRELSKAALDKKIPIIVINMIRKIDEKEHENLESIVSLFTHTKIKLTKKSSNYEGQVILSPLKKNHFWYKITKEGLIELTEAI